MTLTTVISRDEYTGAGSVGPYSYTFRIFAATDLVVVTRNISTGAETTLAYVTDYSVTGVGEGGGGTITLTTALSSSYTLAITRVVPLVQDTDLRNQGTFFPATYENALDYLTAIDQQQQDALDRSLKLSDGIDPTTFDTAVTAPFAGGYLRVNASGDGFEFATGSINTSTYTASGAGAVTRTVTSKLGDFTNLRDYGSDATTDWTSALNAAALAAGASKARTVYIPAGTYTCSAGLTDTTAYRGVTFQGEGMNVSILYLTGNTVLFPAQHDQRFRDMTIRGTWNHSSVVGVVQIGIQGSYLGGSFATRGTTDAEWRGNRVLIERVRFENIAGDTADGLACWNTIRDCEVSYCANEAFLVQGDYATVNDNFIEYTASWGIDFNANHFVCRDNRLSHTGSNTLCVSPGDAGGIVVAASSVLGPCVDGVIAGNSVVYSDDHGILLNVSDGTYGLRNIRITGNHLENVCQNHADTAGAGIVLGNSNGTGSYPLSDIVVEGNTIKSSSLNGIYVRSAKGVTVTGNVVNTTTRAGIVLGAQAGTPTVDAGVVNNRVSGTSYTGIEVQTGATTITVAGNRVSNKGLTGAGQDLPMISLTDTVGFAVSGNTILGPNDAARRNDGIKVVGASTFGSVVGNTVRLCWININLNTSNSASDLLVAENTVYGAGGADLYPVQPSQPPGTRIVQRNNLFTAGLVPQCNQTLTDAATIAVDVGGGGGVYAVTLAGNRTMGQPSNAAVGQRIQFVVIQDGTGGRTLAFHASFKKSWSDTGNTAGKSSSIAFQYDGTYWQQDGAQTSYV